MPASAFPEEQRRSRKGRKTANMKEKPKYVARIDNVYFLRRLGDSLRKATNHITKEELPDNIRLLLRRLERLEARKPD
jgi:hypothetical protein